MVDVVFLLGVFCNRPFLKYVDFTNSDLLIWFPMYFPFWKRLGCKSGKPAGYCMPAGTISNNHPGNVLHFHHMSCGYPTSSLKSHTSYGPHLLDHLAADGAGFAGGQVAVVAVLQVDADLPWCSFSSYFLPGSGLDGSGKLRTGAGASSPTKR